MKRLVAIVFLAVLGSGAISAKGAACDTPPSAPSYFLDVVAIDTRMLDSDPVQPQSLYQAAREAYEGQVSSWPTLEAVTRFRVVASAMGDIPDIVEIKHQYFYDDTSCSNDYQFVRGERYFLTPNRTSGGDFIVSRYGIFTGEQRQDMLELFSNREGRRLLDPTYPQARIERPEAPSSPPQ